MHRRIFILLMFTLVSWVAAKERVLPGAHFQSFIPVFPTLQATTKTLGSPLQHGGKVYAISNSWYFSSYQPATKVAEYYAQRLPDANRMARAHNHIIFTLRPAGARELQMSDGSKAYEWIEIEIAEMSALNKVVKQGSRTPPTSVHISEFVAP